MTTSPQPTRPAFHYADPVTKKPIYSVYFANIQTVLLEHLQHASYAVGCIAWLTDFKILDALAKLKGVSIIIQNEIYVMKRDKRDEFRVKLRFKYEKLPQFPWLSLPAPQEEQKLMYDLLSKRKLSVRVMGEQQKRRVQHVTTTKSSHDSKTMETPTTITTIEPSTNNIAVQQPSMMHTKFLVFFDQEGKPIGVYTGSANLTANATHSVENQIFFYDPAVARIYFNFFLSVLPHSMDLPD